MRSRGRHYTTLEHLAAMFAVLDTLGAEAENPALLAVWYHHAMTREPATMKNISRSCADELRSLQYRPDRN